MKEGITFVGLDAHKVAINVAMLLPGQTKPVEWQLANEATAVRRMVRKVQRQAPGEVRVCYEAGPCGYALQRWIRAAGAECVVVAPSLIPRKPGERIKTDRRDARKLVQLDRAGLLTEVFPPTPEDEAVRDLCRAREDAHQDLVRCRHRLSKLLLREVGCGAKERDRGAKGISCGCEAYGSRSRPTRSCATTTCWLLSRSSNG
jgi:transposase